MCVLRISPPVHIYLFLTLLLLGTSLVACKEDDNINPVQDPMKHVMELAIRQVKADSLEAFEEARAAFIAKLKAEDGVVADSEFQQLFSFVPGDSTRPVFVGMTEYASMEVVQRISQTLGTSAEAQRFFATFDMLHFTLLQRKNGQQAPQLASLIETENGQLLEIAVRNLDNYQDLDAYDEAIEAFLTLLSDQDGFVSEHQWVSVDDQNLAVGMTVYENLTAFQAIASDTVFTQDPAYQTALGVYSPQYGALHQPVGN